MDGKQLDLRNKSFIYSNDAVMQILSNINLAAPETLKTVLNRYQNVKKRPSKPAPNHYTLKSLVGYDGHDSTKQVMPAYSFPLQERFKEFKKEKNVNKCVPAKKEIPTRKAGITFPKEERIKATELNGVPGSNFYNPPIIKCPSKVGGKSFGRRTSYQKPLNTPSYSFKLPPTPTGPKFSIFSRSKKGCFYDLFFTPPPPDKFSVDAVFPKVTGVLIPNAKKIVTDEGLPAPNAYKRECVVNNKPTTPKHTFGIKHSRYMLVNLT